MKQNRDFEDQDQITKIGGIVLLVMRFLSDVINSRNDVIIPTHCIKNYNQTKNANQIFLFYKLYLKSYIGGGGVGTNRPHPEK